MATMKSSNPAIQAMQQLLQERCIAEPAFAIKMASSKHTFEEAVNYLCHTVQKSGLTVLDGQGVINILTHFYDGDADGEEIKNVNCNIVVAKPELSDEDRAELKEQAMEQYKEEQLRELRRLAQPKHQSKQTASVPKAGEEINVQPSLFDL